MSSQINKAEHELVAHLDLLQDLELFQDEGLLELMEDMDEIEFPLDDTQSDEAEAP